MTFDELARERMKKSNINSSNPSTAKSFDELANERLGISTVNKVQTPESSPIPVIPEVKNGTSALGQYIDESPNLKGVLNSIDTNPIINAISSFGAGAEKALGITYARRMLQPDIEKEMESTRNENKITSTVGNIAGSVIPFAKASQLVGKIPTIAKMASNTLGQKILKAGVQEGLAGLGYGVLSGGADEATRDIGLTDLVTGNDKRDILGKALETGIEYGGMGALFGGGVTGITGLVGKGISKLKNVGNDVDEIFGSMRPSIESYNPSVMPRRLPSQLEAGRYTYKPQTETVAFDEVARRMANVKSTPESPVLALPEPVYDMPPVRPNTNIERSIATPKVTKDLTGHENRIDSWYKNGDMSKKDLLMLRNELNNENGKLFTEQIDFLNSKNSRGNKPNQGGVGKDLGGNVVNRFGRTSNNELWFQEWAKDTRIWDDTAKKWRYRQPTQSELKEIAEKQLNEGFPSINGSIPSNQSYSYNKDMIQSIDSYISKIDSGKIKKLPDNVKIIKNKQSESSRDLLNQYKEQMKQYQQQSNDVAFQNQTGRVENKDFSIDQPFKATPAELSGEAKATYEANRPYKLPKLESENVNIIRKTPSTTEVSKGSLRDRLGLTEQQGKTATQTTKMKSSRELPEISNMNKAEFDSYYGLDQKYSSTNIKRLVEDTGAKVINKVGSEDVPTIIKHYQNKYNLPEIKISYRPNKSGKLGTTERINYDTNGNPKAYKININPNQSIEGKVGTLRHEIEHVIDLEGGFKPSKQPFLTNADKQSMISKPMREGYSKRQAGEHKNYEWFEADYLRRASVKDALKEGRKVSQEALDEFPDLKNIKPVESTPIKTETKTIPTETQTKLTELEATHNQRINSLKNDKVMSAELKQKQLYAEGMKYSAKKRELMQGDSLVSVEGGLTPKELADKINYLKSNHSGKEVITPDGEGILTGQSSYGKVGVKIDGKIKYFTKENIQPKIDIDAKILEQKTKASKLSENSEGQIISPSENKPLKNDSVRSENVSINESQSTLPENNQFRDATNMVEPSIGKTQGEGNIRERGFSTNEQTNINSNKTLQENLASEKLNYMQLENKSTYERARQIYDKGYDESLGYFNSIDKYEPHDVPLAHMIANEASKRGDIETARNIIVKISEKLTEAGQFGQAGIIMRRSDPATYYRYINNNINKLNREGLKRYGDKWNDLKISSEVEREIFNLEIIDEASMQRIMERTNGDLLDQMPTDAWEKWDTWRRMSMLLNPKTHIRNIVGNGFMAGLRKTSDTLGMVMEKAFVKQGERTKSIFWSKDKNLVQKVSDDWKNIKEDLMSNNKYGLETIGGLNQEKRIFQTELLEKWNKRSSDWLNKEDEFFMGRAYRDALGQYMKANNLSSISDSARSYASRRALEATFRQTNELANYIIKAKKMKYVGKAIDAAIPFTKTPLNIAKSGVDYSPVGVIKTLFDIRKSPQEAIETLSKGLTGTSLMGLGYYLGSMGWARANMEKSRKASELTELTGEQPYSIVTPLGSYTFDWNQPSSIPLTMGVTLAENLSRNLDPAKEINVVKAISKSLSSAGDSFFNMTVLKNVKNILGGGYGSITEALASLPADYIEQGIPSVVGQVSRSIDTKKRNTYDENPLKMSLNNAMNRTLLSVFLPEKVDVLGESKKQPSWWQQFISPGTGKEQSNDPLVKELDRLYESTKKTDFLPKFVERSFSFDKKNIWLTADEIETFQRKMGELNNDKMTKLVNSSRYGSAKSDELKSKLLNKISEDNYTQVKREILKDRGINTKMKKYVIPSKSIVPKQN